MHVNLPEFSDNTKNEKVKKGKAVAVLNKLSTSHFLDLSTSLRRVVSFTPRPLYPLGKADPVLSE
jgi:hypothetical protein